MKHYLLRTFLLMLLTGASAAHAVTLGQVQVRSFLGQPLDAEIDLIGLTAGQHQDLRLRIANDRHFDRLGIAHSQFLAALTFDVAQSDGRWIVRARSTRPVTEPFLDFPLQMTWPGGQLIKQYTLLLDPPRRIQPSRTTRSSRPAPAAAPARPQIAAGSGAYGPVQSGETLWPIAKKLKPRGITTRQMAMALLRANPQAFIDGNINKLRAGATLTIPQQAFIEQLDAATARAQFTAQTRSWQAPVATSPRTLEAPVSRVPARRPSADAESENAKDAPVSKPPVDEKASNAQLRIVTDKDKPNVQAGSQQHLQEQLLVTMEEIESNRITTGAIESRLARMEAEIDRMQKLVELKDAQIAALQSDAAAREAIQAAAQTAEPPPPPPVSTGSARSGTTAATNAPTPAAVSITRLEPIPTDSSPATLRPWYEEYLWAVWVMLGLMGLAALLMLIRRPQAVAEDIPLADLPEIRGAAQPTFEAEQVPAGKGMKEAEEDFRRLAEQQLAETSFTESKRELPELDTSSTGATGDDIPGAVTDSQLDEMLDDNKLLADHPAPVVRESDFSDDDIASWVAELGAEAEQIEAHSANDERIPLDDDIPSILTELDDQLTSGKPSDMPSPAPIQLDPVGDAVEDDTFSMSLDLARAYLEIGDQDGARDMLKQALSGARDADHRRQIEELLTQID